MGKAFKKIKLSVWQYLALGYLAVILLGSVLLILPFAAKDGEHTSYLNALFTSVSATCVTGLIAYDTAVHWSLFGQIVILLLIQTGGLGFMTFVSVFLLVFRRGIGLYERTAVVQSLGANRVGSVKKLVIRIVVGSFLCEVAGTLLLCIRFIPDFGWGNGIWFSIFHAVSAFCNAGFDVLGAECGAFASLSAYATDPLVTLTVGGLIVFGGLGFCVWIDVIDSKCNPAKFQFYTKLILIVNAVLLTLGTALFLLFERNSSALEGMNFGQRLLAALFNSTTSRTAGFSGIMPESDSGKLLMIFLMFIGGSTGSTAGGLKVGTFTVIMMGTFAVFRGKKDINIGKRRVETSLLSQALAIFAAYLALIFLGAIFICAFEPSAGIPNVIFEVVSALGTVGLSLNLTPALGIGAKIVLILLMYAGRVGILTLAQALGTSKVSAGVRKPVETLYIG